MRPVSTVTMLKLVFGFCAIITVSGPIILTGSFRQECNLLLHFRYTSAVHDDGNPKKSIMEKLTIIV